ncbi:MAG: hypothetical protein MMC23_005535 [Stictis urceolatum]|nr:hypothetical protein [Stictis urceolata]
MSNPLATFIGWSIVPSLATRFVQTVYYGITIRAGEPRPAPGSPRFNKHYQRIQVALIVAYLLYTFYEASHVVRLGGDFYRDLGVVHDVGDRGIKSRFRRLAAIHHPDKQSPSGEGPPDDSYFVHLKLAQDTLASPVKRFAYDRFGPDVLTWPRCVTKRDYLVAGLWSYAPQYVVSTLVLIVLGATGYLQWGRFWRYFLVLALVVLEVYVATRPYHPPILTNIINPILTRTTNYPPLLPFQFLILARNIIFTFFMALSQLGPYLQQNMSLSSKDIEPAKLARLEHVARANEAEASRLLELDMAPYASDAHAIRDLRNRIREWLVQNTIRNDGQVRVAVGEALQGRAQA